MSKAVSDLPGFIANDEQTGTLLAALQQAFGNLRPDLIRIATS